MFIRYKTNKKVKTIKEEYKKIKDQIKSMDDELADTDNIKQNGEKALQDANQ